MEFCAEIANFSDYMGEGAGLIQFVRAFGIAAEWKNEQNAENIFKGALCS